MKKNIKKGTILLASISFSTIFLFSIFGFGNSIENFEIKNNNLNSLNSLQKKNEPAPNYISCTETKTQTLSHWKRTKLDDRLNLIYSSCIETKTAQTPKVPEMNIVTHRIALETGTYTEGNEQKQYSKDRFKEIKAPITITSSPWTIGNTNYQIFDKDDKLIDNPAIPLKIINSTDETELGIDQLADKDGFMTGKEAYIPTNSSLINTTDDYLFTGDKITYKFDDKEYSIDTNYSSQKIGILYENIKKYPLIKGFELNLNSSKYEENNNVEITGKISLTNDFNWQTIMDALGITNFNDDIKFNFEFIPTNDKSKKISKFGSFVKEFTFREIIDNSSFAIDKADITIKQTQINISQIIETWPKPKKDFIIASLKNKDTKWITKLTINYQKDQQNHLITNLISDQMYKENFISSSGLISSLSINKIDNSNNTLRLYSYSRYGVDQKDNKTTRSVQGVIRTKSANNASINWPMNHTNLKVFDTVELKVGKAALSTIAEIQAIDIGYKINNNYINSSFVTDIPELQEKIKIIVPPKVNPRLGLVIGLAIGIPVLLILIGTIAFSVKKSINEKKGVTPVSK